MHVVVSLLLLAAGVTAIAADAQRWYPACVGDRDAPECMRLQDHAYDYVWPSEPWVPVGNSAQLAGVSYALMGLAALLLFGVLLRTWWSWLVGLPFTVSYVVLAAQTYVSGTAGHPVEVSGTGGAAIVVCAGFPLALLAVAAVVSQRRDGTARRVRLAGIVLLVLASPLPLVFLGPVFLLYASHDTTPWLEALGGVFTVLAAGTLLVRERPRPQAVPTAPTIGTAGSVAT